MKLQEPHRGAFVALLRQRATGNDFSDIEVDVQSKASDAFIRRELDRVDAHLHLLTSLRTQLPAAPQRVLDAGCSTGGGTCAAARFWPSAEVIGIDPNEKALEAARIRTEGLGLTERVSHVGIRGDEEIDLPDASFDVVVSCSVLEFITSDSNRSRYLRDLVRLVRPGGSVLLVTPKRLALRAPHTHRFFGNLRPHARGEARSSDGSFIRAHFEGMTEIPVQTELVAQKLRAKGLFPWLAPAVSRVAPWGHYLFRRSSTRVTFTNRGAGPSSRGR